MAVESSLVPRHHQRGPMKLRKPILYYTHCRTPGYSLEIAIGNCRKMLGRNRCNGTNRFPLEAMIGEDEEAVRELASEFLRSRGYRVIKAKDGLEALEVAERQSTPIDILATDVAMPRMRGTELAMRLKRVHPDVKAIHKSGYL